AVAEEVRQSAQELPELGLDPAKDTGRADVAILFDYAAEWLFQAQPQGAEWSYHRLVMDWYSAARALGLSVDILHPDQPHDGYKLILVPTLPIISEACLKQMKHSGCCYLLGPRCGSKTPHLTIPDALPPGPLQELLKLRVTHAESFPPAHAESGTFEGRPVSGRMWLDHVESELAPLAETAEGHGLYYASGRLNVFATVPDEAFLEAALRVLCEASDISVVDLPRGLRLRRMGDTQFAFNYGAAAVDLPAACRPESGVYLIGGPRLEAAGVAAWKVD
ncbi:MAG: beta-galactosidase trimerization domain-containing protein, partial [Pseudomonadota bacterium]